MALDLDTKLGFEVGLDLLEPVDDFYPRFDQEKPAKTACIVGERDKICLPAVTGDGHGSPDVGMNQIARPSPNRLVLAERENVAYN
jgi:hypothetical protein